MSEDKYVNDFGDIILNIPALNEEGGQPKGAYEIGKGWPHYKDLDIMNVEFTGEIRPFFTLGNEPEALKFPHPLEEADIRLEKADACEEAACCCNPADEGGIGLCSLDELNVRLNGFDNQNAKPDGLDDGGISTCGLDGREAPLNFSPAGLGLCGLDEIDARLNALGGKDIDILGVNYTSGSLYGADNSLYGQDGIGKNNYLDSEAAGFNFDLDADFNLDLDFDFGFDAFKYDGKEFPPDLFSQINKRLLPFVKRMLPECGYYGMDGGKKTGHNKDSFSGIVDCIMDKLQNEIDEAEDIFLEIQRTDWSRYRLLRAVTELIVAMELSRNFVERF